MAFIVTWVDKGVIVRFSGPTSMNDIDAANNELYSNEQFDNSKFQIFNFLNADLSDIEINEAVNPAATDKAASYYIHRMKVANVSTGHHVEKIFEAYTAMMVKMNSPWKFHQFHSEEEALEWCNG